MSVGPNERALAGVASGNPAAINQAASTWYTVASGLQDIADQLSGNVPGIIQTSWRGEAADLAEQKFGTFAQDVAARADHMKQVSRALYDAAGAVEKAQAQQRQLGPFPNPPYIHGGTDEVEAQRAIQLYEGSLQRREARAGAAYNEMVQSLSSAHNQMYSAVRIAADGPVERDTAVRSGGYGGGAGAPGGYSLPGAGGGGAGGASGGYAGAVPAASWDPYSSGVHGPGTGGGGYTPGAGGHVSPGWGGGSSGGTVPDYDGQYGSGPHLTPDSAYDSPAGGGSYTPGAGSTTGAGPGSGSGTGAGSGQWGGVGAGLGAVGGTAGLVGGALRGARPGGAAFGVAPGGAAAGSGGRGATGGRGVGGRGSGGGAGIRPGAGAGAPRGMGLLATGGAGGAAGSSASGRGGTAGRAGMSGRAGGVLGVAPAGGGASGAGGRGTGGRGAAGGRGPGGSAAGAGARGPGGRAGAVGAVTGAGARRDGKERAEKVEHLAVEDDWFGEDEAGPAVLR